MPARFILLLFLANTFYFSFGQNAADTIPAQETAPKNLTAKEAKKEKENIARNLSPDSNKALVYIVRPTIVAFAVPMRIDCDSFQIGWIGAKSFLYTMLDSGEHTIISLAENEFHLKVHLEAGKTYYIQQEIRMGIMYARTKLKLINEEEGKKELLKAGLSNHNNYPNFPLSRDVEKSPPSN